MSFDSTNKCYGNSNEVVERPVIVSAAAAVAAAAAAAAAATATTTTKTLPRVQNEMPSKNHGFQRSSGANPPATAAATARPITTTGAKSSPHSNGAQTGDEKVSNCGCRRNCLSVFSESEKLEILKKFRRLIERDAQDKYLESLMEVFPIKRRRLRPEESTVKLRACSVNYFAKYENRTELVCKQGFLALHGVSKKRCARILGGIPKEDTSCESGFDDAVAAVVEHQRLRQPQQQQQQQHHHQLSITLLPPNTKTTLNNNQQHYYPHGLAAGVQRNPYATGKPQMPGTSIAAKSGPISAAVAAAASSSIAAVAAAEINILKVINDHIESFPKTVLQHDNKILYCLDANVTIKKMYEMFRKKYPTLNISYPLYSFCFKENFASQLDLPDSNVDFDNIYEVSSHFLCG